MTALDADSALVEAVVERVRERIAPDEVEQCERFVRQYYRWVPAEDLAGASPLDLYGAAVSHWRLAQQRPPGEARIRVYNPDFEQHGWQSAHTAIELVTDDMPFLVDSLTIELTRLRVGLHLLIHPVLTVRRDADGRLVEILQPGDTAPDARRESVLHAEVDRESEPERLAALRDAIERVLREVSVTVEDWAAMRARLHALADTLPDEALAGSDPSHAPENQAYLRWMDDNHFTFLAYQEFELRGEGEERELAAVPATALGLLRLDHNAALADVDAAWTRGVEAIPGALVLAKASARATVHRPSYLDYVGVKRFDEHGNLVGERRFLGIYTTLAYWERAQQIPVLRGRLEHVLDRAGFAPDSHDRKALLEVLEEYPRDELVQISSEELFDVAMGILALGQRQRVRLFVRRDVFQRFVSCLVFLPRDRFNTANRERIARVLAESLHATLDEWTTLLSESVLVRIHYLLRTAPGAGSLPSTAEVEARLARATRAWGDELRGALVEEYGEEGGAERFERWREAFPAGYREEWPARAAVADLGRIEHTSRAGGLAMFPYRPFEADGEALRCKLFSTARAISLSDVLPIFENLGLRIADERPYELEPRDGGPAWIYDFGFAAGTPALEDEQASGRLQDAFVGVWRGERENDALNRLVVAAGLDSREVMLLRALGRWLRQAEPALGEGASQRALVAHPDVAASLVALFRARLDPQTGDAAAAALLEAQITQRIDVVQSLDEDRVLRSLLAVIGAMTRTDWWQRDGAGHPRPSVAFKLDPQRLPLLPAPRPHFEIFVHSPRVEGVHLRGGRIARGGLRFSDRREDFRTEVLGLMKAQTVKNAVIVPVGAKGGFVVRGTVTPDEVVACYREFVASLLSLTDNVVGEDVVAPADTIRLDRDDPYLVVAADKGTASFSDVANELSAARGFWLGDAFASGGSEGYDHKRMGITARGAWEAVRRHFRELGTDVQRTDFTVVGIGDMSGDVFGNGMLRSPHIRLLAAFDHRHVFVDPDPDPAASFAERERLFALASSSWADYDPALISAGGGVWPRSAKSVALSSQARAALAVTAETLTPDELIRAILCAPVDLLWNGGIGTYVKAGAETDTDVGDRANDPVRVGASALRCRVVGEGGNLGFTQLARVEFAAAGGRINTDAIDNVGGVNCSDREVNIKIALDAVVGAGEMTVTQRNHLLHAMTDEVGALVLRDSYTQTQALSLASGHAPILLDLHARVLRHLEQTAGLDRALEFLPSEDEIADRRLHGRGLTSPELAILMAYTKTSLHAAVLGCELPDDPYLEAELERYFPASLPAPVGAALSRHRLRREIVATHLTNDFVDHAGISAAFTLSEETGADPADVIRGFIVAREVFGMRELWEAVASLDHLADPQTQTDMLVEGRKLLERAGRWLLRNRPRPLDLAASIERYAPGAAALASALPAVLEGPERHQFTELERRLEQGGVPTELATRAARLDLGAAALDAVEIAAASGRSLEDATAAYFRIGSGFALSMLRERILALSRATRWDSLARAALRDDCATMHRQLVIAVLATDPASDLERAIDSWSAAHAPALARYRGILADIESSRSYDLTTLSVALREGRNLV